MLHWNLKVTSSLKQIIIQKRQVLWNGGSKCLYIETERVICRRSGKYQLKITYTQL